MSKKINPKIKFKVTSLDDLDFDDDNIQVFEKFKSKPKTIVVKKNNGRFKDSSSNTGLF